MAAHVMLDLETLGTVPGCVILSIGACTFDPHSDPKEGWQGRCFNYNIDRESSHMAGLIVDPNTLLWWQNNPKAAWEAATVDPHPLLEIVDEFHDWWGRVGGKYIWSNGAGFDIPIWDHAAKAVGRRTPWKYWDIRDTRTIWDVGGVDPRAVEREGPAHSAFADARHQARCVTLAFSNLRARQMALPLPLSERTM